MKRNLQQVLLTSFFILSQVAMFAQGDEDDNGDLEGNDPPAASINSRLVVLMIVGLIYSFYIIKKSTKKV